MSHPFRTWLDRYIGRPEVVSLLIVLALAVFVLYFFSNMLMPVFVSIAIAYLLQWPINKLERWRVPHGLSVIIVYMFFVGAIVIAVVGLLPTLWHQLNNLFEQMPLIAIKGKALFEELAQKYPNVISPDFVDGITNGAKAQALDYGQRALSFSLTSLSNIILFGVYFILVPLLVYFFLSDKKVLLTNFKHYLPSQRQLVVKVWLEVYQQIGRYVRGKVLEAIIMGIIFFIQFKWMGLNYASLMAVLVGLSVIVPYVGAVIVTIPLVIIALVQWGLTPYFAYFILIYSVLTALDANLLVPLIFSEAVNLHPVSIILAVLIFGGLFGFWGVFFAIPLAALVKAVTQVLDEDMEKGD